MKYLTEYRDATIARQRVEFREFALQGCGGLALTRLDVGACRVEQRAGLFRRGRLARGDFTFNREKLVQSRRRGGVSGLGGALGVRRYLRFGGVALLQRIRTARHYPERKESEFGDQRGLCKGIPVKKSGQAREC